MISLLMDASKKVIDSVIKPNVWTVDNAQGLATTTYPRVAFESTVLKHSIKNLDAIEIRVSSTFQYQINFRFDGKLKYEQLPRRELTDILSYLTFIFSSHPTILEKSPAEIDAYSTWQYLKVDPCLYEDHSTAKYSVQRVDLNTFIPIIEQSNNDWLMVLVLSFDVDFECKKSDYRQYFQDALTDQVEANPGLSGGLVGEVNEVNINLYKSPQNRLAASRKVERT